MVFVFRVRVKCRHGMILAYVYRKIFVVITKKNVLLEDSYLKISLLFSNNRPLCLLLRKYVYVIKLCKEFLLLILKLCSYGIVYFFYVCFFLSLSLNHEIYRFNYSAIHGIYLFLLKLPT